MTGYLISYFCETDSVPREISRAARRLRRLQHASGGFSSWYGGDRLFNFDTAQILHGFAALYRRSGDRKALVAAQRCADFVQRMILPDGSCFPIYEKSAACALVDQGGNWAEGFTGIQSKAIEGLLLLASITGDAKLRESAAALARFGREHCDLTYTHPGAYCLEGLLAHGELEFVRGKLEYEIVPRVRESGFIPYAEGLDYAYTSGSVQLAILLLETGFRDEAHRILEWARRVQARHECGGLYQYAREDASPDESVHGEINCWGTKYHCQLERRWAASEKE